MKYSAVALAAFVAVASAQDISIIPECAIPCIDEAAAKVTDCAPKEFKCICSSQETLVPAATNCVLKACGNEVALNEVLPATEEFCSAVLAGGDDEPAETTSAAPEPTSATSAPEPTETEAEETTAAPESSAAATGYPTATLSTVVSSAASEPSATEPAPSSVVTAGAAGIAGSLGLAILGAVAAL